MTADADSEGREWYPKTKFLSDILKENRETKLIGEGRKHYHKTKLIVGTHKVDFLNNIKGQSYDDGNDDGNDENCPEQHPCNDFGLRLGDCMTSVYLFHKKIDDVIECLVEALGNIPYGTFCNSLTELGFCDAVSNCEPFPVNTSQGKGPDWSCSAEMHQLAACIIFHDGCWDFDYNSKCLSGI
jgi:hypothetical protein